MFHSFGDSDSFHEQQLSSHHLSKNDQTKFVTSFSVSTKVILGSHGAFGKIHQFNFLVYGLGCQCGADLKHQFGHNREYLNNWRTFNFEIHHMYNGDLNLVDANLAVMEYSSDLAHTSPSAV